MHKVLFGCVWVIAIGCGTKKTAVKEPVDSTSTILQQGIDTSAYIKIEEYTLNSTTTLTLTKKCAADKKVPCTAENVELDPFILQISENNQVKQMIPSEDNIFSGFMSFGEDHYLRLLNSAGGSGYYVNVYKVSTQPEIKFDTVVTYNELGWGIFGQDGKQLLIMQGIWAMSDDVDDMEAHFDDHVYDIILVDLTQPHYPEKLLGSTRKKYTSDITLETTEELAKTIYKTEPGVFSGIDPLNFGLK